LTIKDTKEICKAVEEWGVDYISFSDGSYDAFKYFIPNEDGTMLDNAAIIKSVVKIPVITTSIHDPEMAEDSVKEGKTDMVGLARGLLADPEWANKVARGERPVKCIRCNCGCWDRLMLGLPLRCVLNPEAASSSTIQNIGLLKRPTRMLKCPTLDWGLFKQGLMDRMSNYRLDVCLCNPDVTGCHGFSD
jgi:tRNA-dihydrouridine synthase